MNNATAIQKFRNSAVTRCLIKKHRKAFVSNIKSINSLQRVGYSVIVGGIFAVLSSPTFAVTKLNQTFTPYVGTSHAYDSNLLRAYGNNTNPANCKTLTDSFINQIRAGLNVDWHLSRQQFIVNADVNQNWFTAFDELDYFGHDVLAQWNWVIGSRLKGEIGYRHDKSLASFAQLNANTQGGVLDNLQTAQLYFANAEYEILPSIFLKSGFLRNDWNYGNGRENSNQIQNSGEFSVQYRNLSKTTIGFRAVITDGKYPNRPDNDPSDNAFFRTSYYLDGEWRHSDKLRLDGWVGYVQQDYEHQNVARPPDKVNLDFSDVVARLDINWLPSEKTTLVFSAWRAVDQAFTSNATFVLSTGVRVRPMWLPTAKIRVEMPISYENQSYLGGDPNNTGVGSGQNTNFQQVDDIVDVGLNLIYTPWLNTELSLNVKHEDRSSNADAASNFTYDAQTVGINAKVEF